MLAQQAAPAAAASVPAVAIVPQEPPPTYQQTQPVPAVKNQPGATIMPNRSSPVVAVAQPSRAEQIKTILAVIGAFAILFHGIRLIGAAAR